MSEVKLLPCPFCGGEAKISTYDWGYSVKEYWIYCHSCDCASSRHHSKEEAVQAWNTRKPMDYIVERFEKHKSYNQMILKKFPKMGTIENAIYKTQRDTYENAIEIVKGGVED